MTMIDFKTVMQRIREILTAKENRKKILDRELASMLRLDPQYFAVIKRRNKIPYEAIACFCKERQISMNWILMEQEPVYLSQKGQ